MPPAAVQRLFGFYFNRLYVHVRPGAGVRGRGRLTREPELFDTHMEEVRSGHDEEPESDPAAAGRPAVWDGAWTSWAPIPGGGAVARGSRRFPFSVRVPISVDQTARRVRIGAGALGVPIQRRARVPHRSRPRARFQWQGNFQVRGELVEEDGGWALVPHRLIGGLELAEDPEDEALRAERQEDDADVAHRKKNETRTKRWRGRRHR